jgi:quercetin dioxygenase-like cupin family protein
VSGLGYVRLYVGDDGDTHFEDVALAAVDAGAEAGGGQGHRAAPIGVSEVIFRHVVDAGGPAVAHCAPRRQFVVQLAGETEVEASDGEVRRLGPGSVVLVEDVDGPGHVTRAVGGAERLTLFIPLTG